MKKEQPDRDYINVNDRAQDMQKGRKTRPYMCLRVYYEISRFRDVQYKIYLLLNSPRADLLFYCNIKTENCQLFKPRWLFFIDKPTAAL